jgi:hypothetical protein
MVALSLSKRLSFLTPTPLRLQSVARSLRFSKSDCALLQLSLSARKKSGSSACQIKNLATCLVAIQLVRIITIKQFMAHLI